ncbi:MAG: SMC-Scp complex subunit ScpB, partial [Acidimicrobiales bacterium]
VSRDPGPGNAVLFGTTAMFLERLGIDSLDDLPPLIDFVPEAHVVEALEEGLRPETPGVDLTQAPEGTDSEQPI